MDVLFTRWVVLDFYPPQVAAISGADCTTFFRPATNPKRSQTWPLPQSLPSPWFLHCSHESLP